MSVTDWTLWPRDPDLTRRLDPLTGWTDLTLVERWNAPHTWTVSGPARALQALAPGMGMVIDRDGAQIASGKLRDIVRSGQTDETTGIWREEITAVFISDADDFHSRIVLPDPTHPLTGTVSRFAASHERLDAGPASDQLWALFHAQAGAGTIAARRLRDVVFDRPAPAGVHLPAQAIRLAVLGEAMAEIAEAGHLALDLVHDEPTHGHAHLAVTLRQVRDLTDRVRFGNEHALSTGRISSWSYRISAPTATTVVVAAGGELEERGFTAHHDHDGAALWARSREHLVDRRDLDWTDPDNLQALATAGTTALEDAATAVAVEFDVVDGADVTYRTDYQLGDLVAVDLPGLPGLFDAEPVREVTTQVTADAPDRISVTVGTSGASSRSTRTATKVAHALHLVRSIERNR